MLVAHLSTSAEEVKGIVKVVEFWLIFETSLGTSVKVSSILTLMEKWFF